MKNRRLGIILILMFLVGCTPPLPENVVLNPEPREITTPTDLPEELVMQPLYWKNQFIYLDGTPMEGVPSKQLIDELNIYSNFEFSHNYRYIAYEYGHFFNKIGIWDTESQTHKELVNTLKDLPYNAILSGITFTSDDKEIIFAFSWNKNDRTNYGLATVNIKTGELKELEISNLGPTFYNIESSTDGKWVASDMATLNNQVCLLINLEEQEVKCLTYEEGWYDSVKFTTDNKYIVYNHLKKINSPSDIMLSKIDGTQNNILASGFFGTSPIIVTQNEIVFIAGLFDNTKCPYVYVINRDGDNLRKLSYLGEQCDNIEKQE